MESMFATRILHSPHTRIFLRSGQESSAPHSELVVVVAVEVVVVVVVALEVVVVVVVAVELVVVVVVVVEVVVVVVVATSNQRPTQPEMNCNKIGIMHYYTTLMSMYEEPLG